MTVTDDWTECASRVLATLSIALSLGLAAVLASRRRSRREHWRLVEELLGHASDPDRRVHESDFEDCPVPVRRYFETVLETGQPHVGRVRLEQCGRFRLGDAESPWKSLRATQRFTVDPPGFVWDATIRIAPLLPVSVADWFVSGHGGLRANLHSALPVARMGASPEMDEGELLRYLAEAVWFPTALLPAAGVEWEGIDTDTARATLDHDGTSVSLTVHFDDRGLVERVVADDRPRTVDGELEPTPWTGEFGDYETHNGMLVPTSAAVAWNLPDGDLRYFEGELTSIEHRPVAAADTGRATDTALGDD